MKAAEIEVAEIEVAEIHKIGSLGIVCAYILRIIFQTPALGDGIEGSYSTMLSCLLSLEGGKTLST